VTLVAEAITRVHREEWARVVAVLTMETPTATSTTCRLSSSQSMPGVVANPRVDARAVPTRAATTPIPMVSQIGMFCLPGATSRPNPPMINPMTSAVMSPVTSMALSTV
jgi:hypothetical protein